MDSIALLKQGMEKVKEAREREYEAKIGPQAPLSPPHGGQSLSHSHSRTSVGSAGSSSRPSTPTKGSRHSSQPVPSPSPRSREKDRAYPAATCISSGRTHALPPRRSQGPGVSMGLPPTNARSLPHSRSRSAERERVSNSTGGVSNGHALSRSATLSRSRSHDLSPSLTPHVSTFPRGSGGSRDGGSTGGNIDANHTIRLTIRPRESDKGPSRSVSMSSSSSRRSLGGGASGPERASTQSLSRSQSVASVASKSASAGVALMPEGDHSISHSLSHSLSQSLSRSHSLSSRDSVVERGRSASPIGLSPEGMRETLTGSELDGGEREGERETTGIAEDEPIGIDVSLSKSFDATVRETDALTLRDTVEGLAVVERETEGERVEEGKIEEGLAVEERERERGVFRGGLGGVNVAVQVGEHWVCTGCGDGMLRLYDMRYAHPHSHKDFSPTSHPNRDIFSTLGRQHPNGAAATASHFVRVFKRHVAPVLALIALSSSTSTLSLSADARLVSADAQGQLRVWQAGTGKCLCVVEAAPPGVSIYALLRLASGRVASASADAQVKVWNLSPSSHGKLEMTFSLPAIRVYALCQLRGPSSATPNTGYSSRLACACDDGSVHLLNARTRRIELSLQAHVGACVCVIELHPSGYLCTASKDMTISLWDLHTHGKTPSLVACLRGHSRSVRRVVQMSEHFLCSASLDGALKLWNLRTRHCEGTLEGHEGEVLDVTRLTDGRILSASKDETSRIWDLRFIGMSQVSLSVFTSKVYAVLALDDSAQRVATGGDDRIVRLWDLFNRRCDCALEGHTGTVYGLALVPGHLHRLASVAADRTVRVWDTATGRCRYILEGHSSSVSTVCPLTLASPPCLLSGSKDCTLRVWALAASVPLDGCCLRILKGHSGPVLCAKELVDGRAVSSSQDHTIRVWDIEGETCVRVIETGPIGVVYSLVPLSDGRRLCGAGMLDEGVSARVWDLLSGDEVLVCRGGHQGYVSAAIAVTGRDGERERERLCTGGEDGDLRVWDLSTGLWTHVHSEHRGAVLSLAQLKDGRLVSGSVDGAMKVWHSIH